MADNHAGIGKKKESIFLSEIFMGAVCLLFAVAGLATLVLCVRQGDSFAAFGLVVKLVTAVAMYRAFRFFKWDVAKGLMGGVLFCIMYHEAYLVLVRLRSAALDADDRTKLILRENCYDPVGFDEAVMGKYRGVSKAAMSYATMTDLPPLEEEDAKKAIEVAIELKYAQCLQTFLNYKHTYENRNNHVI